MIHGTTYVPDNEKPIKIEDLTDKTFGELHVVQFIGWHYHKKGTRAPVWLCKCSCGNEVAIDAYHLKSNHTKSCGCKSSYWSAQAKVIHGETDTLLYNKYLRMIKRCYDPTSKDYPDYGGRGIYICEEWYNPNERPGIKYKVFSEWAHSTGYVDGLSIDRKDVNGPYAPWNCRWADDKIQANNRRSNIVFYIGGKRTSLQNLLDKNPAERNIKDHTYYRHIRKNAMTKNEVAHAILHSELGLHVKRSRRGKGKVVDKDGFQVMIPRYDKDAPSFYTEDVKI